MVDTAQLLVLELGGAIGGGGDAVPANAITTDLGEPIVTAAPDYIVTD